MILISKNNFFLALTQNIQIQALPQTVNYKENDLVIVCSITNPSQLKSVYTIELQKNASTTFTAVVTIAAGQTPLFQWNGNNNDLQGRATPTGNLDSPSSAQLRLTIDKDSVRCPTDFLMYRCSMTGLGTSGAISQSSESTTVYYNGMYEIKTTDILCIFFSLSKVVHQLLSIFSFKCYGI